MKRSPCTHRIGVALLLAALASACSSTSTTTEPGDTGEATEANEQVAATVAPDIADPEETVTPTAHSAPAESQAVVLVDAGSEPWISLSAVQAAETTISVEAIEDVNASFGEWEQLGFFFSDYDLMVTSTPRPNGFELVVDREVLSLSIDADQPVLDEIAGYTKSYNVHGVASPGLTEQERLYNQAMRGLLSTPNLVLAVPTEPVGVGAQWTVPLDRLGESTATVTLEGFDDRYLQASLTYTSADDESSFTMTAHGQYSRSTLLANSVSTESVLVFETQAEENGTVVDVSSEQRSTRTYSGATS